MKKKVSKTVINGIPSEVTDSTTGEIIVQTSDKTKITIEEETDEEENEIIYDFNKGKPFVKLYLEVNKLRKYLTQPEFVIAMSLADYICYDDCILRKGGHQLGKILTIDELAQEMDMKYDTLRKTLVSLNKKGVLAIYKVGCRDNPNLLTKAIIVNPHIYTKGCNINKTLLGIFSETKWDS